MSNGGLALLVASAVVLIALIGAVAGFVANHCTERVGQWVANDLRPRIQHPLQRLSPSHHDWDHSHKLDLSDGGLLSDLEKRGKAGEAGKLVLED